MVFKKTRAKKTIYFDINKGVATMLGYFEDLGYDNYRECADDIKDSIKEIIRIEELGLGTLALHLGISRQALHRHFKHNKIPSFRSLNKMNNFLRRYREKLEEIAAKKVN